LVNREENMNLDQNLLQAIDRMMKMQNEIEFLEMVKTIKLELMLIRAQDRMRELEHGEWAELEQVD
jgi:hypothetical protein